MGPMDEGNPGQPAEGHGKPWATQGSEGRQRGGRAGETAPCTRHVRGGTEGSHSIQTGVRSQPRGIRMQNKLPSLPMCLEEEEARNILGGSKKPVSEEGGETGKMPGMHAATPGTRETAWEQT